MGNFFSSDSDTSKDDESTTTNKKEETKEKSETETETKKLSENGNPFCKGYLVTNSCNSKKYPPNPQNSMDNPNLAKCDQRFISVANTESSTGYLQCKLSKDGKTCNAWNEVDKSDKVKCDLEVDGLPYCESDILHGPGNSSLKGKKIIIVEQNRLKKLVNSQKEKCRCEDGKSVKGETSTIKLVNSIKIPTYQWYCG